MIVHSGLLRFFFCLSTLCLVSIWIWTCQVRLSGSAIALTLLEPSIIIHHKSDFHYLIKYPIEAKVLGNLSCQRVRSSVHYCEDRFHIHVFHRSSNIWLPYIHNRLNVSTVRSLEFKIKDGQILSRNLFECFLNLKIFFRGIVSWICFCIVIKTKVIGLSFCFFYFNFLPDFPCYKMKRCLLIIGIWQE